MQDTWRVTDRIEIGRMQQPKGTVVRTRGDQIRPGDFVEALIQPEIVEKRTHGGSEMKIYFVLKSVVQLQDGIRTKVSRCASTLEGTIALNLTNIHID